MKKMDSRFSTCVILCLLLIDVCALRIFAVYDDHLLASPPPASSYHECCKLARHQDFCLEFMTSNFNVSDDQAALTQAAIGHASHSVKELIHTCKGFNSYSADSKQQAAIRDCSGLLEDASELISSCLSDNIQDSPTDLGKLENMQTWMSAALTDYTTCIDGLDEVKGSKAAKIMKKQGAKVEKMISTALSFIASMYPPGKTSSEVPQWVKKGRILATARSITPNVTVAQDGSGQFSSISAAVAAAPNKSTTRYVIYVKQGIYTESFEVPKTKPNIMLIGDGIRKTVITGSKSVQDPGVTTFSSATVVVSAKSFLAQGITFQNTAGAIKHQAVALRVSADQAAFYKCSFEGFQDTLYAHSQRQFYSQCRIYGTVDYIFGNAAAVFQSCELVARVPLSQQKNTHTAQGREDPNQNTGFSFQNCTVDGNSDLKQSIQNFPTYLGRPWKEYSLTVFLNCYEGDVINPAGWLEWSGSFALSTLFYGEYLARGPGARSSQRVSWSTQIRNASIARRFTAASLLSAKDWLPQTSFPFTLDL